MTAPAGTATPDVDPDNLGAEGVVDDTKPPEGEAPAAEKDWEAEFKAQQRVNRDLERRSKAKMRELEQQLADATKAKSEPAKAKPDDGAAPDFDAIRKQVRDELSAESLKDRALDKLEAKAARLFQNPEDARTFLAGRVGDFIDDGKVDVGAIGDALADLLKERPYLGVTQGDAKRFQGTADSGARGTAGKPQMTDADVKRLYKEGKHAEIEQARTEGRLNTLLGIKPST